MYLTVKIELADHEYSYRSSITSERTMVVGLSDEITVTDFSGVIQSMLKAANADYLKKLAELETEK